MGESKTIAAIEEEIIDEFQLLEAWDEDAKYEYIIDLGKKLPPLDDKYKIEDNRIRGCQSTVWLVAAAQEGRIHFDADSNSVITKGLVALLVRVLSDHTPDEIINAKLDFINTIGMHSHLAQTRSNGLLAMVKQMKNYALAFKLKEQTQQQ